MVLRPLLATQFVYVLGSLVTGRLPHDDGLCDAHRHDSAQYATHPRHVARAFQSAGSHIPRILYLANR